MTFAGDIVIIFFHLMFQCFMIFAGLQQKALSQLVAFTLKKVVKAVALTQNERTYCKQCLPTGGLMKTLSWKKPPINRQASGFRDQQ